MTLDLWSSSLQDLPAMATAGGQLSGPSVVVTREVRWFFDGPLPSLVFEWFSSQNDVGIEQRVDQYDLDAAHRGVGLKRRSTTSFDSKFRISIAENLELGPGLRGHVEEWMKISEPISDETAPRIPHAIDVSKELYTRDYPLNGSNGAGGEAELAAIAVGSVQAWSVCFETYGPPDQREAAFHTGIARLLDDSPLPPSLEMGPESCHGYPEWISSLAISAA